MEELAGFIVAGLALSGSPGPATLSLAAAGAAFGAERSLGYLAGLTIGLLAVMGITAAGVMGILLALPGATVVIIALASAYFIYLAFKIATAPPLSENSPTRREPSFAAGVMLSLVDPKGYAAMAALFSGFMLIPQQLVLDSAFKALVLMAIVVAVNFAWLYTGAALTRLFREPRANRVINVSFAVLLLASLGLALFV